MRTLEGQVGLGSPLGLGVGLTETGRVVALLSEELLEVGLAVELAAHGGERSKRDFVLAVEAAEALLVKGLALNSDLLLTNNIILFINPMKKEGNGGGPEVFATRKVECLKEGKCDSAKQSNPPIKSWKI